MTCGRPGPPLAAPDKKIDRFIYSRYRICHISYTGIFCIFFPQKCHNNDKPPVYGCHFDGCHSGGCFSSQTITENNFSSLYPTVSPSVRFLTLCTLTKPLILSHIQPKNRDQDPGWTNHVPLRGARGVLPFCLKNRENPIFHLAENKALSWPTSCWKTGAFG